MMEKVSAIGLDLDKSYVEDGIEPNYQTSFQHDPTIFDIILPRILRNVDCQFSDLDDSVKRRWQDSALNYKPENLEKFREQLDSWKAS
jgi:hypothetical protein